MADGFRSIFEGEDEFDYAPDPLGRVGDGSKVPRDPTKGPAGQARFDAFRRAWNRSKGLSALFGRDVFRIKAPVAPQGPNRRPDVAKVETFLQKTGDLDLSPTEGPTGYYSMRLEEALNGFQRRNGLMTDGIVNPGGETVGRMAARLARGTPPSIPKSKPRRARSASAGPVTSRSERSGRHNAKQQPQQPRQLRPKSSPAYATRALGNGQLKDRPTTTNAAGKTETPMLSWPVGLSGLHPKRSSKQKPASRALRAPRPFGPLVDYFNTKLGALQGISPHVVGPDGRYAYEQAPENWQRYYRKHQDYDPSLFVLLVDPIDGKPKLWFYDASQQEPGYVGAARVITLGAGFSSITNAPKVARGARTVAPAARRILKPAIKHNSRFTVADYIRNAKKAMKAKGPAGYLGPKLWERLSPEMQALFAPRMSYFTGRAAEHKTVRMLDQAGFTVQTARGPATFAVTVNGKPSSRIYDLLTEEQIKQVISGWYVKPLKSGLPTGVDVKLASSKILKKQAAADKALLAKGKEIAAAQIMRMPASKASPEDIALAINEWLKRNKGSAVLTDRQRRVFEQVVSELQAMRLENGAAITLGKVMGLSLLLALQMQDTTPIPNPPKIVPHGSLPEDVV